MNIGSLACRKFKLLGYETHSGKNLQETNCAVSYFVWHKHWWQIVMYSVCVCVHTCVYAQERCVHHMCIYLYIIIIMYARMCKCCMRACVRVCISVCVHACEYVCV